MLKLKITKIPPQSLLFSSFFNLKKHNNNNNNFLHLSQLPNPFLRCNSSIFLFHINLFFLTLKIQTFCHLFLSLALSTFFPLQCVCVFRKPFCNFLQSQICNHNSPLLPTASTMLFPKFHSPQITFFPKAFQHLQNSQQYIYTHTHAQQRLINLPELVQLHLQ